MSQIFYRQMLVMPQGQPDFSISSVEAGRMSQLPHAGPGGVATTPSAAIFSGCGWWHYRYSFGRRSNALFL